MATAHRIKHSKQCGLIEFTMPKTVGRSVLIKELSSTKIWTYVPETKYVLCKLCSFSAKADRKSVLEQHRQCTRHEKNVELHKENRAA